MADLLPARLSRWSAVPATALIVAPGPADNSGTTTISLSVRHHRREQDIGRFPLNEPGLEALRLSLPSPGRRWLVVLRLAPDLLLEREVDLPLAAEPEIGNTLRFSIDSLTPFAAHELFWSWAITLRDRVHGRLHVRLSVVCKAAVEPLIAALRGAGVAPKLLEFALSDIDTRVIAPDDGPSRGSMSRRNGLACFGGLAAGALVAIAVLPVVSQMRALAETDARIAALQPRVAKVVALRRAGGDADGVDVVARERARVGDALHVLAIVTNALPDNTYLTELSLHQRKLALSGESGAAAKVIVALSAEPALRKPEFVAPVTRAPMGGRDIFSIEAEVEP
jgi:general secretion pathway protein L